MNESVAESAKIQHLHHLRLPRQQIPKLYLLKNQKKERKKKKRRKTKRKEKTKRKRKRKRKKQKRKA